MSTDHLQRVRVALVAVATADAGVQAVTGRATRNLVAWRDLGAAPALPVAAYHVVTAVPLGAGWWRATVQITAAAATEEQANALLAALSAALTAPAFAALPTPLDAYRESDREARRAVDYDTDEGAARADLDVSLCYRA